MTYGRRSYRSYRGRKPASRKYTRGTRKRFSKKRFAKYSSAQKSIIRAPVNARETYVKLPWVNTFSSTSLTTGTSSSRVFLGNSLVPFPTAYNSGVPTAGDEWVSGVAEYSAFYNQYRVLGSSIRLQVICQTSSGVTFGVCLIPVAFGGSESGGAGTVTSRVTELDAMSYDDICMQPGAKCRLVGIGSGGNASVIYKVFRKTKAMLACKDLRDNENTLLRLPDTDGTDGTIATNGNAAFFYYVRVFNLTGSTGSFDMQVKIKYYANLSGRTNWLPLAAA